jgi:hypothetical protein
MMYHVSVWSVFTRISSRDGKEMFMFKKKDFAAEVKATFQDRSIDKFWWYIAFETDKNVAKKGGPILFMGAAIVEAPTMFDAISEAFRGIAPRDSSTRNQPVQIPDDKLPAAEYRNRLLTKEEVQQIFPEVSLKRT